MTVNKEHRVDDTELNQRGRKVPLRTKLFFASGTLQEATIIAAGITTVLYYNQVLGVSPALVGTAYLIAGLIDAISDPMIGAWSDKFKSRWGRRHPFMFVSALPTAIAFFCLYQPLDGLGETGLVIWLTVFLSLTRLGQTFYLIPHDALGAELTDDYEERTSIFGYNSVSEMLLGLLVVGAMYTFIFPTEEGGPNGLLNQSGYFVVALVGAPTIIFSVLLCCFGTLDQLPFMRQVDVDKKFFLKDYLNELMLLLRNRSYLCACLSLLTFYAGLGIIAVVAAYAYIYAFELTTEEMFWSGVAKLPGVFLALPLLHFLSKRLEKREIVVYAMSASAIIICSPYILALLNLLPPNDSPYLIFYLFIPLTIGYVIMAPSFIVVDSQLADVADEHELNTRQRAEGVIFAIRSFGKKTTQGFGGFIAGLGLETIGFPDNAIEVGVSAETINGLLILNGPVYLAIYALGVFFMCFYRIDKDRHAQILRELSLRRSTAHHE